MILKIKNIQEIDYGTNYGMAVTETGEVYSFGINSYGQLGLGNKEETKKPTLIGTVKVVKQEDCITIKEGESANAKVTLNNSTIVSHADFQDKATADATRVAFSGRDDFEYFLALNGQATLGGRDLIINPNGSRLAVQDDAKIKLNIVSSSTQDLEVECNRRPNINILGMRWEVKKNND